MPDHSLPPSDEGKPKLNLMTILPVGHALDLTESELAEVQAHQLASRVLGPAAGSVLMCPGNQVNVPEERRCPYSAKCPLLRMLKAPANQICPFERDIIQERFSAWSQELGYEPDDLPESARATISDLVWLDIQEQRCLNILSKGEAARLTQINVKEVHPETGEQLSWERVIHANLDLLDRVHTQRRMIFKDWELTPEMKTKRARIVGKGKGDDLSTTLAAKADKLRRKLGPVVDIE